ncbi:hypothetical protein FRC04_010388 [Tulasnella sp. 424]|nr:hypothetical protein FRC04_010388 [Tulasnella sp. 424]KAG8978676.1 hypothetical protein FRC05_009948 [Tulasnella sp. 425]
MAAPLALTSSFASPYGRTVPVSGEIEVDVSMFRRGQHVLPFSIGIHFTRAAATPLRKTSSVSPSESDSEDESSEYDTFRGEWNQDGPGNYYRRRSFIKIHPRLMVDDICYTKFTIDVPVSLLPPPNDSRLFNVAVKAYELGNPYNVTEPSMARFMVLNQATTAMAPVTKTKTRFSDIYDDGEETDDSDAGQAARPTRGCAPWKITRSLSWRIKRTSAPATFRF